jgi:1,4-alpha-glucan branching enzyme
VFPPIDDPNPRRRHVLIHRPGPTPSTAEVTFIIEPPADEDLPVSVVGEFNDWDHTRHHFEPGSDGRWRATLILTTGRAHAFRYLTATGRWFDEPDADDYSDAVGGGRNSIVDLTGARI